MENLSKEDLDDVREVFKMLDVSADGRILANEAYVGLLSLQCKINDPSVQQLMQTHQQQGITFEEFQSVAVKTMPSTWSSLLLRKCFKAIDLNNTGRITDEDLFHCVEDLGLSQHINKSMILDMIARGSNRQDMTEQEFVDLFDTAAIIDS